MRQRQKAAGTSSWRHLTLRNGEIVRSCETGCQQRTASGPLSRVADDQVNRPVPSTHGGEQVALKPGCRAPFTPDRRRQISEFAQRRQWSRSTREIAHAPRRDVRDLGSRIGRISRHNARSQTSVAPVPPPCPGFSSDTNTYLQWETAYGGATMSVRADPLFVSPTQLRLRWGSPCVGAGIEVGIDSDIVGVPVPAGTQPDLGAFQSARRPLQPSRAPR